ncbi:hypothetical protein BFP97_12535 [Roseivirga sp. 4D4]|uniref:GIY-YIG nuclease family protein n=1 Tax=Roseivirga sp. 4D4 TaxID=1889784 RepID=UPI000853F00A|nr:GIY-YIG nuclease family protein [Roseivirga sp. 4D4]OEK02294.1 hypothetical protein BFP97_12535 [Roseivirga sp. 4D4]
MVEFYVYIIYSESRNRYYVGSCDNLTNRLADHNAGRSKYTKSGKPWVLRYSEIYSSRGEARKREAEIKKKKSRRYIEYLVNSAG